MVPHKVLAAFQSGGRYFAVRSELLALWTLSWPVVMSRLGIMAMGLADTLVVGRFSAVQLGYHAMAWTPTSVGLSVSIGLLTGIQVMTARAMGEGRPEAAGAVLRRGLVYAVQIGLVGALFMAVAGPAFLDVLGLPPDLARGSKAPLIVFALSMPAHMISVAISLWLEGLSRPRAGAVLMWVANGVNLGLDLLLVPGALGLPAMGAVGGAWAMVGARTFLSLALVIYVVRLPDARALGLFRKPEPDRAVEAEQRRVGYGAGASSFFEVAAFSSMNVIAGWISATALAGYAIVLSVMAIVFMVPLGLSTAVAVRVGQAYGSRDPVLEDQRGWIGFAVTLAFGVTAALILWPLAGLVASGYTTDPEARVVARAGLLIACLMLAPDALQVVAAQALRARGDVWAPTVTHLASYALVMVPLAYVLAIPFKLGVDGIIWAIVVASLLSGGLLVARFWQLGRLGR